MGSLARVLMSCRFTYPLRERTAKTVMDADFFPGPVHLSFGDAPSETPIAPDKQSLDEVFSLAYEELRRLARSVRRGDPHASITPTALVNEAWIKLSQTPAIASASAIHFRRIAARAMRQVLVDTARRRQAGVRGSGAQRITFDEASIPSLRMLETDRDVLALDTALCRLHTLAPRQAALVEARFFGGLEMAEVAELLGISESTALRDWRAAKAWLAVEIRQK